jgi:hypothetical protein
MSSEADYDEGEVCITDQQPPVLLLCFLPFALPPIASESPFPTVLGNPPKPRHLSKTGGQAFTHTHARTRWAGRRKGRVQYGSHLVRMLRVKTPRSATRLKSTSGCQIASPTNLHLWSRFVAWCACVCVCVCAWDCHTLRPTCVAHPVHPRAHGYTARAHAHTHAAFGASSPCAHPHCVDSHRSMAGCHGAETSLVGGWTCGCATAHHIVSSIALPSAWWHASPVLRFRLSMTFTLR